MAIETEIQREPIAVEPVVVRPKVRLHEEILPPQLDPSSPTALRSSRRALLVLAVGMILIQLVSAPVGHQLNAVARSGTDGYSVWQQYASSPVPDVLVIGASPARSDIDEPQLAAALSTSAGHPITVEKLGFAGQTPLFLDALVYRIMKRTPHPKVMVVVAVGPELNSGCNLCITSANGGLWDISDLTDPAFTQDELRLSPNPALLIAGWAFPSLAYYPSLIALQCMAINTGRAAARAALGRVPIQLQNETVCEGTVPYKWARQPVMTQTDYQTSLINYAGFMVNYRVAPDTTASVVELVTRARAGGSKVIFLETPLHPGIRTTFPAAIQTSQQELQSLATSLGTSVIDLSDAVPDDPTLWVDGLHLDRGGADYLNPRLAAALAPIVGQ
jgi:hypothetical protein